MRTFAQKQNQPQRPVSSSVAQPHSAKPGLHYRSDLILHLQRTIGNQAVQGILQAHAEELNVGLTGTASSRIGHDFGRIPTHSPAAGAIQTKLEINRPGGDVYEQEADYVSERVTRVPEPQLQRACACGNNTMAGGECSECRKKRLGLRTKLKVNEPGDIYEREADRVADQVMATPAHSAVSSGPPRTLRFAGKPTGQVAAAPASVDQVLASPGRPLDPALRQDMEQRFGYDFSSVRVHSGTAAEQSARDVNAHAYTVGHNMVFGAGQPALGSREGQKLLAHELTHVMQQSTASALSVVQRQAGGGAPAGGAPAGGAPAGPAPAGGAPAFSVKYNGCGRAPYTQAVVEAAALAAYNRVASSNCVNSQELKNEILSEFANLTIDCEQGGGSSPCGMAWRFLSHTVNIYPKALTPACGPLESTILHEAVHLTELRLIEHGGLADACEASCFGWGRGDPAKCSEKTLVRHGPRFAFGLRSGAGGSSALGRVGYEVIRSWTGTAFSLGLRLDVPLTNRESFVRAGLEVGTNFQLLSSLYGRLFGGLATPLPPGAAPPSMFVGAGLGWDFGRTQLEVLYDILDIQSKDERTHQLMLGLGFRFGK